MNFLSEDEQEAALRCIAHVSQHGGQATEKLPTGDVAYACRKAGDHIAWSVKRSNRPHRIEGIRQ